MKEQLTKEKIIGDYERTAKNKKTLIGISSLAVFGIVILGYGMITHQVIVKVVFIFMGILLIFAPVWTMVYTSLILKALKQNRYQVVVDHVKKITSPHLSGKYKTPGYLVFRKNGKITVNNHFVVDPNDDTETKLFEYWENAQVGDPFYLVMVKKNIIQIYNPDYYCFPEKTKE